MHQIRCSRDAGAICRPDLVGHDFRPRACGNTLVGWENLGRAPIARLLGSGSRLGDRRAWGSLDELCKDGAEELDVDDLGTLGLGEHEPGGDQRLDGVVPGEVVDEESDGEGLEEREEAEDSPVGQPLNVILRALGLKSAEGE